MELSGKNVRNTNLAPSTLVKVNHLRKQAQAHMQKQVKGTKYVSTRFESEGVSTT
jgi:hypothetical protein